MAVRIFFVLTFIIFTCSFPYIRAINNPNENVRIYMTMAIVEEGTVCLDKIVARYGWVNDMARVPAPSGNDPNGRTNRPLRYFSVKAPAVSYAGVPIYWALTKIAPLFSRPVPDDTTPLQEKSDWLRLSTLVLRLFVIQLPCFAFLIWLERWLRLVTRDTVLRLTAVAAAGLGTNYLAYSLMFVSHSLFAVAAFASFAITTREFVLRDAVVGNRSNARAAFFSGLFAGLATLLEYHALPVSIALTIYAFCIFWKPIRLAYFIVGGGISVAILMAYQWCAFNNPFTPGHRMVESAAFAANHARGLFGIVSPTFEPLFELSVNRTFGFFSTSPFMLLGLLAPALAFALHQPLRGDQRRWATAVAVAGTAMLLLWLSVSAFPAWRGGWTIGPRYLGAAPIFFAFAAALGLEQLARTSTSARTIARGVAGGFALAGVANMGLVSLHYNTLPEDLIRPLVDFTIPLIEKGLVPRNAAQLLGISATCGFTMIVAALFLAGLVAACWRLGCNWRQWFTRILVAAIAACIGLAPAFWPESVSEARQSQAIRDGFEKGWNK